jgi:hypothetical protein
MKNILVLLLMIMLPLQASWSAAAVFCQHETLLNDTELNEAAQHKTSQNNALSSWHWGHHQHEPDASCMKDVQSSDQQNYSSDGSIDNKQQSPSDVSAKHTLNFASHSDHLNVNQQAIKQPDTLEPQPQQSTYAMIFAALPVVFYQSPILEQPEPPLWFA